MRALEIRGAAQHPWGPCGPWHRWRSVAPAAHPLDGCHARYGGRPEHSTTYSRSRFTCTPVPVDAACLLCTPWYVAEPLLSALAWAPFSEEH